MEQNYFVSCDIKVGHSVEISTMEGGNMCFADFFKASAHIGLLLTNIICVAMSF